MFPLPVALGAAILLSTTNALELDITQPDSIRDAASNIAYGMMSWYTGNNTGDVPGNLPDPYYWWHAGAMFMSMVDYWYYTGDNSYVDVTKQAMIHQAGDTWDFMPENQTKTEGNDDQLFWALSAMSAAEVRFPNPDSNQASWVAQVQNVFDLQTSRWDDTCGGGLRWQIFTWNKGYNYKNTISNGGLFQISARLARYTGDAQYVEWAAKVWDWSTGVLFQNETDTTIVLNDGATTESGCTRSDPTQWTYIYGVFIAGTAYMYNHTRDQIWLTRTTKLLNTVEATFFINAANGVTGKVMSETACEPSGNCDIDQQSFKAYLTRWMVLTAQMVPSLEARIWGLLRPSAQGAALQCSGGGEGPRNAPDACGRRWDQATYDGTSGLCEQMAALQAVSAMMLGGADGGLDGVNLLPPASVAAGGGGTSKPKEDGGGGKTSGKTLPLVYTEDITAGDKAGAAILTILLVSGTLSVGWWML
ncbi:putative glycosyl hydrolase family 76 protein [Lasiodiplodia theobromae]|uniref:Mannan endo-1,6-alpha-mannosidase n=1 Tax=Lasiodiplodia theobromae TaxID=45133 RepID=A0A5N5DBX1_9PEZI|nr:Glycoside hydrolase family 76 [Lasiodiplodia theobromae]KAB2575306.1 Mannan endo-1,6-alpha-mannosidase DCW1 [Lasiodiplodia theobromae]KAF4539464.1 Glycoside hydrolase family 76 [Lasiodiplodia theobromae]KAF9639280.1 putative glycosyl hydrolase family 76 protein [Lasiodiplodia theobromae]